MKTRLLLTGILTIAMMGLPVSPASAHGFHHGGDGLLFGALGAVVATTAYLITAPVRVVADVIAPAPPAYYAPQPAYVYAPAPVYQRPMVVYSYPAPYYAYPAQGYYGYPQ